MTDDQLQGIADRLRPLDLLDVDDLLGEVHWGRMEVERLRTKLLESTELGLTLIAAADHDMGGLIRLIRAADALRRTGSTVCFGCAAPTGQQCKVKCPVKELL